jgi:lipopolysaccharide/colanic/teichoic acid biosynthesis glycosyltransferase
MSASPSFSTWRAGPPVASGHPDGVARWPTRRGQSAAKRTVDLLGSSVLLLVLGPLLLLIAAAVRVTSPGAALFRQPRLGRDRRPFVMCKFRTMQVDGDDAAHREFVRRMLVPGAAPVDAGDGIFKLVDDPRVTLPGRVLRRTSLDELPQLLNVWRGHMSLVGPRPALPWEAELFQDVHAARFLVPPGMTGLWQVSGRSRLSMAEALDRDVEYVQRQSLLLDLLILLKTLPAVLRGDGAR